MLFSITPFCDISNFKLHISCLGNQINKGLDVLPLTIQLKGKPHVSFFLVIWV